MLVSISGIDGVGKTSLSNGVVDALKNLGFNAIYSRPKFKICKQMEFYFFQQYKDPTCFDFHPAATIYFNGLMMDWLTHATDFLFRNESSIIISDRYVYDVLAQGIQISADTTHFGWFEKNMPMTDLSFYIKSSAIHCFDRIGKRASQDRSRFENLESLNRLIDTYDFIMSDKLWSPQVIENKSLDATIEKIVTHILSKIADWKPDSIPKDDYPLAKSCNFCCSYLYP